MGVKVVELLHHIPKILYIPGLKAPFFRQGTDRVPDPQVVFHDQNAVHRILLSVGHTTHFSSPAPGSQWRIGLENRFFPENGWPPGRSPAAEEKMPLTIRGSHAIMTAIFLRKEEVDMLMNVLVGVYSGRLAPGRTVR